MKPEQLIFSQLLLNEEYVRKVIPHLKEEYFSSQEDKNLFKIYTRYFNKYNKIPSKQAMRIEIDNLKGSKTVYDALVSVLDSTEEFHEGIDFLVEETEKFCKQRAIFNALRESVLIVDGQDKTKTPEAIPSILQEALSICFNTTVGHDYIEEADDRYDYYHLNEARIPTGFKIFDEITRGGFPRKTLNVLLAPPHGGKSLIMTNFAAGALKAGYNVLYITMEMAEFEIAKRIDVNLMDIDFDTLESISKPVFDNKFAQVAAMSKGKLRIKEYPTEGAHPGHFRALLEEYRTKQNFVPDLVVVDYMSICLSERHKAGGGANSYTIVKSIGAELRALAIVNNFACISAVQTTRAGVGNSDVDMSQTSESFGVPAIADWMCAIINTEELKQLKQIMFKQLKNRYKNLDEPNKFLEGVDYGKMRLFDLEESASKINFNSGIKNGGAKPKPKIETANDTFGDNFNLDVLHTINPLKAGFDDFKFD
jgi:replicative DNA helicase